MAVSAPLIPLAEQACPPCERADCRDCGVRLAELDALANELIDLSAGHVLGLRRAADRLQVTPGAERVIDRAIDLVLSEAADGLRGVAALRAERWRPCEGPDDD